MQPQWRGDFVHRLSGLRLMGPGLHGVQSGWKKTSHDCADEVKVVSHTCMVNPLGVTVVDIPSLATLVKER